MEKANKIVLICSLVACILCLGMSIWLAFYTHDSFFYGSIAIFLLATVWLGVNAAKKLKEKH